MVDAGFGDGVGGVWLGLVDDVAGHGGCEDDGGGGGAGDCVSVIWFRVILLGYGRARREE